MHNVFARMCPTAWLAILALALAEGWQPLQADEFPVLTNIHQARDAAHEPNDQVYELDLKGDILWANAVDGQLVLKDSTGADLLEFETENDFPSFGQRIRIQGLGLVHSRNGAIRLGPRGPVVDNDGIHSHVEKSGTVHLPAGWNPIRLEWFNATEGFELQLEYEGPGITRRKFEPDELRHSVPDKELVDTNQTGLAVSFFETFGELLPNAVGRPILSETNSPDFALRWLPKSEYVGARFSGWFNVRTGGLYRFFLSSDDGSRLWVGSPSIRLTSVGVGTRLIPRAILPGQITERAEDCSWASVEGKVGVQRGMPGGLYLELGAGAGRMQVRLVTEETDEIPNLRGKKIRVEGICKSTRTSDGLSVAGLLFVPNLDSVHWPENPSTNQGNSAARNLEKRPLLTAAAIHSLKREEAAGNLRVKLSGVVTCVLPEHQAFVIQDSTRGIYVVDFSSSHAGSPELGELLEVEGTTDPGLFAPVVNARRVSSLGNGATPEPQFPSWDQLVNGSLDAQLVEVQGIVTVVRTNELTLLLRGGIVRIELRRNGEPLPPLSELEDALVRIRGCLLASWDYVTHQVRMGDIRIYAADVTVEKPPPQDLFSGPKKTIRELLLFDPQAGLFQRVRVSGQVICQHDGEYFAMEGDRGLRFFPKSTTDVKPGDLVDIVGFPDLLGNPSPKLLEAAVRKSGAGPVPLPRVLPADDLVNAVHDSTRVRLQALLVDIRQTAAELELELQSGVRTFIARMDRKSGPNISFEPGSRLEIDGTYAGLGGNSAAGQDMTSFEILVDRPHDIRVLSRPPWWTLPRLLMTVGGLLTILVAAGLWITLLHRQVDQRSAELEKQIHAHQQVEHQRAMEQERSRIAQDLHDELGSGITEIGMLARRAKTAAADPDKHGRYLEQVGTKARELVTGLDEIVWAMDPRHDSVASMVSYFSLYADRFLSLANLTWTLTGPPDAPDRPVDSRRRHQLFLAFKEALTNVVRHANATEVRIHVDCPLTGVAISVADNGRGIPTEMRTENMNGINNMRLRIERLGGTFAVQSKPGHGTTVRFEIPAE